MASRLWIVLGLTASLCAQSGGSAQAKLLEEKLHERLAQPSSTLDLDLLMLGEDFFGKKPGGIRFEDSGRGFRFRWKRWDEKETGSWHYDLARGELERLPDDAESLPSGRMDPARERSVFVKGEALCVQDLASGEVFELLRTALSMRSPRFSVDGEQVFFSMSDGLWSVPSGGGGLRQLLVVAQKDAAPEEEEGEETLGGWHRARQLELFRLLSEHVEKSERQKTLRLAARKRRRLISRWSPPKGWTQRGFVISPKGDRAVVRLTRGSSGTRTKITDYVTVSGYSEVRSVRPKVGDRIPESRLLLIDLKTGESVSVDNIASKKGAVPGDPQWSPDGEALVAVARSDDDTEVFIVGIDPATGATRILHHNKDLAWVLWSFWHRPHFLGRGHRAVFLSEASGWAHLYLLDAESGDVRQLTKGEFEISSPQPTPDGRAVYALASVLSPHSRELVRIDLPSGEMTILSQGEGGREISLGPKGKTLVEVYSRGNRPWELRVLNLEDGGAARRLTDSPSPAFKSYGKWDNPEIITFRASDGVAVPARIYRPSTPLPGRPAVVFVHGAGYLQNVHRWWSAYYREYGFHHLLRDEGYTVLDVDYRGSAGYGAAWRTAVYGHMGGRDLEDFVDAADYLVKEEGCSKDRIGIYGGSYGGFITLMALFNKPGVFRAGAALRPVTDWSHYNDGYTSNILDDPLESPEHYAVSSPINFAQGLADHLLICHGLLDDNVHVQGVLRLQQRLIELRKDDWEVALYPLERHGFQDPASWRDEYTRIKKLFDRVLRQP